MKIISITKQEWKTISPTKSGIDNQRLDTEYPILFNTNEMITAEKSVYGGTRITYKKAMVDVLYCKETLEQVTNLINK
jgi:hypothetical protein